MYASALRVWAGFMDPYERIVVNPDHEFHGRVASAHANANDDDPDKANLVSAKSYAGRNGAKPTPLFTTDEQTKRSAQELRERDFADEERLGFRWHKQLGQDAVQPTDAARWWQQNSQTHHPARPTVIERDSSVTTKIYGLCRPDAVQVTSRPTSLPRARRASQSRRVCSSTSQRVKSPHAATFTETDHQTAQHEIDRRSHRPTANPPWEQSSFSTQRADGVLAVPRAENIFTDFWNWLKREFEKLTIEITDVFVSIADEVMVGIRMLWNGVETVFKAIVKVIDDVASAIGSFFKMLLKFIEDVIAALSVLFHFGHIIATQKYLRSDQPSRHRSR